MPKVKTNGRGASAANNTQPTGPTTADYLRLAVQTGTSMNILEEFNKDVGITPERIDMLKRLASDVKSKWQQPPELVEAIGGALIIASDEHGALFMLGSNVYLLSRGKTVPLTMAEAAKTFAAIITEGDSTFGEGMAEWLDVVVKALPQS